MDGYTLYLPANSWWVILVGYPDLEILTTSNTPQHLSCCKTRSSSYKPGSCLLFGFMQRMKWGVVVSSWCISLNSWTYKNPRDFLRFFKTKLQQHHLVLSCTLHTSKNITIFRTKWNTKIISYGHMPLS